MKTQGRKTAMAGIVIALSILWLCFPSAQETPSSYIVQTDGTQAGGRALVEAAGGHVTHELGVISAVGAEM